jgi:hypothetical protein
LAHRQSGSPTRYSATRCQGAEAGIGTGRKTTTARGFGPAFSFYGECGRYKEASIRIGERATLDVSCLLLLWWRLLVRRRNKTKGVVMGFKSKYILRTLFYAFAILFGTSGLAIAIIVVKVLEARMRRVDIRSI